MTATEDRYLSEDKTEALRQFGLNAANLAFLYSEAEDPPSDIREWNPCMPADVPVALKHPDEIARLLSTVGGLSLGARVDGRWWRVVNLDA